MPPRQIEPFAEQRPESSPSLETVPETRPQSQSPTTGVVTAATSRPTSGGTIPARPGFVCQAEYELIDHVLPDVPYANGAHRSAPAALPAGLAPRSVPRRGAHPPRLPSRRHLRTWARDHGVPDTRGGGVCSSFSPLAVPRISISTCTRSRSRWSPEPDKPSWRQVTWRLVDYNPNQFNRMSLSPGARVGSYEVVSLLGVGGMGEVYRARDTRLQRDVALKILPEIFAGDPERLARFEREAQMLASLNHPHIAAIHGWEESGGTRALILELVEGETLADQIARGALPLDEALPIAKQIAGALEAAHEQGIIHRDLKPANIKITPAGVVKVLDFGLAKLQERQAGAAETRNTGHEAQSLSPTIAAPALMTGIGMILGTAVYMAPEQAKGKPADKRSDIWAFGCVLYEMLTGRRPFGGDDVAETLACVISKEPDWQLLPAGTPPLMRRLLSRCLEKDRRRRLRDIGDALNDLDDAASWPSEGSAPGPAVLASAPTGWRTRTWLPWSLAAGLALALVGLGAALFFRGPPVDPAVFRSTVLIDASLSRRAPSNRFTLSPDGQRLAYVARDTSGRVLIWVRPLAGTAGQPLSGTDDANALFWSPDSQVIAFIANRKLKKIAAAGGAPITLSDATVLSDRTSPGSWSRDDVIVFQGLDSAPLMRVAADGERRLRSRRSPLEKRSTDFRSFFPTAATFSTPRSTRMLRSACSSDRSIRRRECG